MMGISLSRYPVKLLPDFRNAGLLLPLLKIDGLKRHYQAVRDTWNSHRLRRPNKGRQHRAFRQIGGLLCQLKQALRHLCTKWQLVQDVWEILPVSFT